jgi:cytosine/uracil/thiamine/allantoin permease
MISFIIGFILGGFLGILTLAIFVAGKPETDTTEAFEDGVEYGLKLGRDNGAIIAHNDDEIMVEYKDNVTKRFREVKETN